MKVPTLVSDSNTIGCALHKGVLKYGNYYIRLNTDGMNFLIDYSSDKINWTNTYSISNIGVSASFFLDGDILRVGMLYRSGSTNIIGYVYADISGAPAGWSWTADFATSGEDGYDIDDFTVRDIFKLDATIYMALELVDGSSNHYIQFFDSDFTLIGTYNTNPCGLFEGFVDSDVYYFMLGIGTATPTVNIYTFNGSVISSSEEIVMLNDVGLKYGRLLYKNNGYIVLCQTYYYCYIIQKDYTSWRLIQETALPFTPSEYELMFVTWTDDFIADNILFYKEYDDSGYKYDIYIYKIDNGNLMYLLYEEDVSLTGTDGWEDYWYHNTIVAIENLNLVDEELSHTHNLSPRTFSFNDIAQTYVAGQAIYAYNDDDILIFKGLIAPVEESNDLDGITIENLFCYELSKFDLEREITSDYVYTSDDPSDVLEDIISDNCNFFTIGTIDNSSKSYHITFKKGMLIKAIFIELQKIVQKIIYWLPNGALYFNDGDEDFPEGSLVLTDANCYMTSKEKSYSVYTGIEIRGGVNTDGDTAIGSYIETHIAQPNISYTGIFDLSCLVDDDDCDDVAEDIYTAINQQFIGYKGIMYGTYIPVVGCKGSWSSDSMNQSAQNIIFSSVIHDANAEVVYFEGYSDFYLKTDSNNNSIKTDSNTNRTAQISSGGSGLTDIVDDTSPQLGGDLDANGHTILNISNNTYITWENAAGDGSVNGIMVNDSDFIVLPVNVDFNGQVKDIELYNDLDANQKDIVDINTLEISDGIDVTIKIQAQTTGNDALAIMPETSTNDIDLIIISQFAEDRSGDGQPHLKVFGSADSTDTYIDISHDGTNGSVSVESGKLVLDAADSVQIFPDSGQFVEFSENDTQVEMTCNVGLEISADDYITISPTENLTIDLAESKRADIKENGDTIATFDTDGLQLGGSGAKVTTILDEDDMTSDSATALATQQSIKKYIDDNPGSGISDVVDDTTPQLGGDLDCNGHTIVDLPNNTYITARNAADDGSVNVIIVDTNDYVNIGTTTYINGGLSISDSMVMDNNKDLYQINTGSTPRSSIKRNGSNYLEIGDATQNTGIQLNEPTTTAKQITSTLAIGTKPLAVTSTTLCDNLNADLLDGNEASAFEPALTKGNLTATAPAYLDQTRQVIGGAAVVSLKNDAAATITGFETTWTDSDVKIPTSKLMATKASALISSHAGDDDAHHTKYTDAEAVSANVISVSGSYTAGKCYYYSGSWTQCDADTVGSIEKRVIGFAISSSVLVLFGKVTYTGHGLGNYFQQLFVDQSGGLSATPPTISSSVATMAIAFTIDANTMFINGLGVAFSQ